MHFKPASLSFYNIPTFLAALVILSGCLVEEEADATRPNAYANNAGEILKSHELTGSVGDGPVVGASILVSSVGVESLASVDSDSTANFNVIVQTQASHYPLQLEAIGGTDLVTMAAPDFRLRSAVLNPDSNSIANLNPFTTVAMELASDLAGGYNEANILRALDIVSAQLGGGLISFSSSGPMTATINGTNVAEIVKASEALGEVIRRSRDALRAVGREATGDEIVAAIASDLADGVLDGRGGSRADARTAAVANLIIAQVMLESMSNRLQVQGSDATARMKAAIAAVFPGTPNPALDELAVTGGMLVATRVGLRASMAFESAPVFDLWLQQLDELRPGMTPEQVSTILSVGAGSSIGNAVLAVATASDADLERVNAAVRSGTARSPNRAPRISGLPVTRIDSGSAYSFTPGVSDEDGDALTFSISNAPSWMSFDTATGHLSGLPTAADIGISGAITIRVSDARESAVLPDFTVQVQQSSPPNSAPLIAGSPPVMVLIGSSYTFVPQASDADGDTLTFAVGSLPSWATFDATTGRVSGTPGMSDAGVYGNITITVSDGEDTATLAPFRVSVDAVTLGAATLSWTPPTENEDGSSLTDLAGYRIYWRSTPGAYTGSIAIGNPGLTSYVIENLAPGTYEFVSTAINSGGVESAYSNPATRTIP